MTVVTFLGFSALYMHKVKCVFLHWASINSEIFAQLKEHYMVKVLIRIETGIYPSGINKYLDTVHPLLYYINHNTHNTQSCIQNKVLGNELSSQVPPRTGRGSQG